MNTFSSISGQSGFQALKPIAASPQAFNLVEKVKGFFRGSLTCGNPGHSRSARDRFNSLPANLASVTTSHGQWVYTVVPWED
jgi:hypothetical protein